jgi:hypothetical protein
MTTATTVPATWDDYHRAMSGIAAEMIGAASYLDEHPDYATVERVADTFRRYADRMRAVEVPQ